MSYKLVIFDFDGTLADSLSWFLRVINEVADKYRFRRIKRREIPRLRSYDARRTMEYVGIPTWKLPLVQHHVRRRMTRDLDQITLFPGIDDLLRRLRGQGINLAIVTSNSAANVHAILGEENASLIQHYACEAPILGKRVKLRSVLRRCGTPPSETIFIGDEIRDLQAAHAEGLAFGAVPWGVNSVNAFASLYPEEIFSSIEEIVNRVAHRPRLTSDASAMRARRGLRRKELFDMRAQFTD
jgi:phosphoglycolate phosphatase